MATKLFDIIICGAGPAGCTAAITLRHARLKTALIDRAIFPRMKACGDAIPGQALKIMNSIDPNLGEKLWEIPQKEIIHATRIVTDQQRELLIKWQNRAYNCPRYIFDKYLLDMVKKYTNAEIFQGKTINRAKIVDHEVQLADKNSGEIFKAKIVIGADGANSIISRKLAGYTVNPSHISTAIRGYFRDVQGVHPGIGELFFFESYLPGYFWMFPVGKNLVNAGFGMHSESIAKKNINITEVYHEILKSRPGIYERFQNAQLVGKILGHTLPHGSSWTRKAGDHFMLCGDAASLIDPLDGHGIDTAMLSGKLAAEQVIDCFKYYDFSEIRMVDYDKKLRQLIGSRMKKSYILMKLFSNYPQIFRFGMSLARNPILNKWILKAVI